MLNVDLKKLLLNCTQWTDSAKITFPCLVREVEKYNTNANIDFDIDYLYQPQEFLCIYFPKGQLAVFDTVSWWAMDHDKNRMPRAKQSLKPLHWFVTDGVLC